MSCPAGRGTELDASLDLVRTLMTPNWDIHPEMVSHTWVIDTRTGRPYPERTADFMENWGWSAGKSTDQLAEYMSFALRILKSVGLTCEGITTPGGFGNRALPELAQGVLEAGRDVFRTEIPHYFRHLFTDERSVAPRVEYASGLDGPDPKCVVSIIGCTGDWFGGWDGLTPGSVDAFITADLNRGRLPEIIRRREPAIMVCHWPGLYFNGQEVGFKIFQEVVRRLHDAFDTLIWMKLSEIARYWAARELTQDRAAVARSNRAPRSVSVPAIYRQDQTRRTGPAFAGQASRSESRGESDEACRRRRPASAQVRNGAPRRPGAGRLLRSTQRLVAACVFLIIVSLFSEVLFAAGRDDETTARTTSAATHKRYKVKAAAKRNFAAVLSSTILAILLSRR